MSAKRAPNPTNRTLCVQVGDKLEGRYEIIDLIEVGGMGAVFLAEHIMIKRRVALKVLHPELATDTAMVKRFMNEALAAGTLGHPNIVEATDMGFANAHIPFIVFEYLQGAVLTEEIYRIGGMSPRRALTIARKIASALETAHNANIVHLDLKCDNVILTDKDGAHDHVKVLDFGISKFLEADSETTQPAVAMGTPEFMAPEQLTMPDAVDRRADIYALGVCLYEMLTATRPFGAEDPRLLMHRIVHEPPPALNRPTVSTPIEAFVMRLLDKDRERRPQTMTDVIEQLDALLPSLRPGDSQQPFVVPAKAQPLVIVRPQAPRKRAVAPWVVAMLAVAAAGGALEYAEPTPTAAASAVPAPTANLTEDAHELAGLLSSQAKSAQLRASAIARSPMLRAAIETDGPTIADMVKHESLIDRAPSETVEFFQLRGGTEHSLLRVPQDAAPIDISGGPAAHLVHRGDAVILEVSAPVLNQAGDVAGAFAVAMPVDLGSFARKLSSATEQAALLGLEEPIVLRGGAATSYALREPIVLSSELSAPNLALAAAAPAPAAVAAGVVPAGDPTFRLARNGCFVIAGALLLLVGWIAVRR